jgi:hypothetical protein
MPDTTEKNFYHPSPEHTHTHIRLNKSTSLQAFPLLNLSGGGALENKQTTKEIVNFF